MQPLSFFLDLCAVLCSFAMKTDLQDEDGPGPLTANRTPRGGRGRVLMCRQSREGCERPQILKFERLPKAGVDRLLELPGCLFDSPTLPDNFQRPPFALPFPLSISGRLCSTQPLLLEASPIEGTGPRRGHQLFCYIVRMAERQVSHQVSSSTGALAGSYERLRGDGEPTRHVCVMGVSERDDEALREVSLSFGEVLTIERNAKV